MWNYSSLWISVLLLWSKTKFYQKFKTLQCFSYRLKNKNKTNNALNLLYLQNSSVQDTSLWNSYDEYDDLFRFNYHYTVHGHFGQRRTQHIVLLIWSIIIKKKQLLVTRQKQQLPVELSNIMARYIFIILSFTISTH